MSKRITELWAVLVTDEDGHEGIAVEKAIRPPGLPMIAGDRRLLDETAETLRRDPIFQGRRIEVVRFSGRETVDVIDRRAQNN